MEIWHRITFNASIKPTFLETIKAMGITYKTLQLPGSGGLLVFLDIAESNFHWPEVSGLISSLGAADLEETFFTEEEIRSAEWLRMICVFEQGYPQPKMSWPFNQPDRELLCPKCAIYRQIAPMHIAKEPHLGKKAFMTTIWTHEIFCIPAVFSGFEEIHAKGCEAWDVILHKTGETSQKVRQLYVPAIAEPGLVFEDQQKRMKCPECSTVKFTAHMRGILRIRRESLIADTDFMLTNEWFGSGYLAWREIIVSNKVAQLVLDRGWQGVRFKVVEVV
jgi:rubredoxin